MEEQNSSCVIPGDIITYDILTRVPPESLLRFRCVCKSWSGLFFDNRLFVKLYCQRYDNKSISSGVIDTEHQLDLSNHEYTASLVFINHNGKKTRIIPFNSSDTLFNTKVHILHSLNGILLLRCYHDDCCKYYVYNPITRSSTIIPLPMNSLRQDDRHCFCLCYDPLIQKHKVVFCGPNGIRMSRYESTPLLRRIKIITVGDGLGEDPGPWRDIVVPAAFHYNFNVDQFCLYGPRIHINGNCKPRDYLYGMVKPHGTDEYYILRLDATSEVYVKIKLPNEVSTLKLQCVLNETEGLLCLSHYTMKTHELRVWTLKDYICDEWAEIRFSIIMEDIIRKSNVSSIRPLTILTDPKMKLIFAAYCYDEGAPYYIPGCSYYSYDIELKQLEMIHGPKSYMSYDPLHWHANTFANC